MIDYPKHWLSLRVRIGLLPLLLLWSFSAKGSEVLGDSKDMEIKENINFIGNEVFYYLMVDRFFDGDPDNNMPIQQINQSPHFSNEEKKIRSDLAKMTYDPSRTFTGMYWGGDLRGIIEKLPYLKDLGVTALIITPIMDAADGMLYAAAHQTTVIKDDCSRATENSACFDYRRFIGKAMQSHIHTSYHGYWLRDWYEIDEHFRDGLAPWELRFEVFRELLNEAKAHDIKILLDITLNQTSPPHNFEDQTSLDLRSESQRRQGDFTHFPDFGSVFRHGTLVAEGYDLFTKTVDPKGWFHPPFEINWRGATKEDVQQGMLGGGMMDFNQKVPAVRNYLFEAAEFWLRFNEENNNTIAGFRLDAVKHVANDFWWELEPKLRAIKPDIILVGEYFSSGITNKDSLEWLSGHDQVSQFDFDLGDFSRFYFAGRREWRGRTQLMRDVILRHSQRSFQDQISVDASNLRVKKSENEDIPVVADDNNWLTFFESHDYPRLKTAYPEMSDAAYLSGVRFLMAARGVPMLMYGTETALGFPYHHLHKGLFGIGGDPFNRPMMAFPGSPEWRPDIYAATKEAIEIRKRCPVLRYGATRFLKPNKASALDDIFMVRYDLNRTSPGFNQVVLYTYSTKGGTFTFKWSDLSIDKAKVDNSNIAVSSGLSWKTVNDGIQFKLKADESGLFYHNCDALE
jgi:glycosidase